MLSAKNRKKKFLFKVLFCFGFALILLGLFGYYSSRGKILSFTKSPPVIKIQKTSREPVPTQLSIPKIKLTLPVEEAEITNGIWQVSEAGVSHLNTSGRPGESGNIVIYGHNKRSVFGNLNKLKKGDLLIVKSGSKSFRYKINLIKEVKPDNLKYVFPTASQTLTVYTCSGIFDSRRLIIQATQ